MKENIENEKNTPQIQTTFGEHFNFDKAKQHTGKPKRKRRTKATAHLEKAKTWVTLGEVLIGGVADKWLETTKGKGNFESFRLESTEKKELEKALVSVFQYYEENEPHPIWGLVGAALSIYGGRLIKNIIMDKIPNNHKTQQLLNGTTQPTETTPNAKESENNAEIERLKKALEEKDEKIKTLGNNNQKLSARNSGLIRRIKTAEKRESKNLEQSETIRKESEQSESEPL